MHEQIVRDAGRFHSRMVQQHERHFIIVVQVLDGKCECGWAGAVDAQHGSQHLVGTGSAAARVPRPTAIP
jgi:hypothetical protein